MTPIVFKLGGEALTNEKALKEFLLQIKLIKKSRPVVIVHGGGPQVEDMTKACNLTTTKINGVRATPVSHLPFIVGALAGVASQQLLAACKATGLNAVSMSLSDADLFSCQVKAQELGVVGKVAANNPDAINTLLNNDFVVLLNSIGCDDSGQTLNINADDAAVAAASLLAGDLVLLSNVPGVLDQDKALIPTLNKPEIDYLIKQGVISDGMVVKVNAAYEAAQYLRRSVNIGSWQDSQALSDMQLSKQITLGTQICA